uniref:DUF72 domain-containing protein n=1 Tax=Marinobacterium profundum TaxID=1714300 RepID=UPI00082E7055|nr:DUF72 domain-containing protein [Marinobacterium profundum]
MPKRYYIGLPQWNHSDWGSSALSGPTAQSTLQRYASHFSSVEGNSTFYALPNATTIERWRQETPEHFRFCLKLPQQISHHLQLRHCQDELRGFIDCISPLQEKLGQLFIQLPARFGPDGLDTLRQFITQLPEGFSYTLEVRHPDFFAKGDAERALNRLLIERGINRTLFDTRALFALPRDDAATQDALQKKPRVPLHVIATGQTPMVRFISPLDYRSADPWLAPWVGKVASWLNEGRQPYLFFHTPDNRESPLLAEHFARELATECPDAQGLIPWVQTVQQQETLF